MRRFGFINAGSFEEAARRKAAADTDVMAGGTDILNVYKQELLEEHPDYVVNLRSIPDSSGIEEQDGELVIKAMTKLTAIEESPLVQEKASALAQAAKSVATPLIRNMGTIGGNICQDVRCWYYRYPHEVGGRMMCARKGGDLCYAIQGDNRYHSIFGGMKAHTSSCTAGCPAGTDIPAYMERIRNGDWDAAAEILLQVNPMPMCTARICPHPCQDGCNQGQYGDSVGIHCVERTLGDHILDNGDRFYRKPETESGKRVAVVGAGPGGLTCAYHLRKQGHTVTVYDAHEKAGGVLYYGIPHYRLPKSIVERFTAALAGMGIRFVMGTRVGTDIPVERIMAENDYVYMGTGAWKRPILGLKGEELTQFGLNFLVEVNTYLKSSIGGDVLVVGGGNVAMDVALTAKRLGAENVHLVCLESEAEMPASREEIQRAREEGVTISNGWGLKAVLSEHGAVTVLQSMRCLRVYDENGRFDPVYDETELQVFRAQTTILATGQQVDLSFLGEKLADQIQSPRGSYEVDETYQTRNEKLYAGGDAVTGPNIAIRAIAAGGAAAKAICKKLGTTAKAEEKTGFLTFDAEKIKRRTAAVLPAREASERTLTDEDTSSLSMEQAQEEAGRCMNCGCYSVNASDISPVLVALDGTIVTTKKEIGAKDFFTTKLRVIDMLDPDELVTAVRLPDQSSCKTGYEKMRIRTAIDFAIVSLAYAYRLEDGKIAEISLVLGGVAPVPVKLGAVEQYLIGRTPDAESAKAAGELAVKGAAPMAGDHYKVNSAQALVSRLVEAMCDKI